MAPRSLCQTHVKHFFEVGFHVLVHVLADEDEFLHAVAIGGVPVLFQFGFGCQETVELVLGHGGVPLSAVFQ